MHLRWGSSCHLTLAECWNHLGGLHPRQPHPQEVRFIGWGRAGRGGGGLGICNFAKAPRGAGMRIISHGSGQQVSAPRVLHCPGHHVPLPLLAKAGPALAPAGLQKAAPSRALRKAGAVPPGRAPLKNVLLDSQPCRTERLSTHTHLISAFSEVRFPPEPKQCEQLNACSRKTLKKVALSLLHGAISFPEEPDLLASAFSSLAGQASRAFHSSRSPAGCAAVSLGSPSEGDTP